jgi:O-antigen/teichoic acid export membrane protein
MRAGKASKARDPAISNAPLTSRTYRVGDDANPIHDLGEIRSRSPSRSRRGRMRGSPDGLKAPTMTTVRSRVFTALKWTAIGRASSQALLWGSTLMVMRLLRPEDYGLIATADILITFVFLLNEVGVIPALIQKDEINDYLVRQVFGVLIISNGVVFTLLWIAAPYFAMFFDNDALVPIVRVLACQLLILAAGAVPTAMLQRRIAFKGLSVIEFIAMVGSAATTLTMAFLGHGVWSLVVGSLVLSSVRTTGVLALTRFFKLPVFDFRGLGRIVKFGAHVTGQQMVWYLSTNFERIVIGKVLGQQALGLYSVANNLAMLPMTKLMSLVNQIAFPAFSRLQNDIEVSRGYFLKGVEVISVVSFPLLWGMSSVGHEFVAVILGERWIEASIVLVLMSAIIPFRIMNSLLSPLVGGLGRPDIGLRNVSTTLAFIVVGVGIGVNFGIMGVAIGAVAAYVPAILINCRRSLRLIDLGVADLFAAFRPSLLNALMMVATVLTTKFYLGSAMAAEWRLGILIATGVVSYAALTLVANRRSLQVAVSILRG